MTHDMGAGIGTVPVSIAIATVTVHEKRSSSFKIQRLLYMYYNRIPYICQAKSPFVYISFTLPLSLEPNNRKITENLDRRRDLLYNKGRS
jgi:hypothetical protein